MKAITASLLWATVALGVLFAPPANSRCNREGAPPAGGVHGFCLEGPFGANARLNREVPPNGNPPFMHWDLREFPGCTVPYSYFDGTDDPETPGTTEFDVVDQAFAIWEAVAPALIAFRRVLPAAGARCPGFLDGHNMLGWDGANCGMVGDDVCLLAGGCACGATPGANIPIIGPGPDGFVTTRLNGCPGAGNDDRFDVATGRILAGANRRVDSILNQVLIPNVLAVTFLFNNPATGVFTESDILFNDRFNWRVLGDNVVIDDGMGAPDGDVRTVALHEIGHFLGLAHVRPNAPEVMFATAPARSRHTLGTGDTDGLNFLYTPDLGDAPDAFAAVFNKYPSRVHSTTAGRQLNGQQLFTPARGAEHLFGIFGSGAAPRYQYEWLGFFRGGIDDSALECEARLVDQDRFDDGVQFGGNFVPGGAALDILVGVRTANDVEGRGHTYDNANRMFINAWFDWNADGNWDDPGEHVIGAPAGAVAADISGNYAFKVTAPAGAKRGGWARFRLDYREDVAQVAAVDTTLSLDKGAAQFGEVEDYPIPFAPPDQLHLQGPAPNSVHVNVPADLTATVQANFHGLAGEEVVFSRLLGSIAFTNGTIAPNGLETRLTTDANGRATVQLTAGATGTTVIKVTVKGTSLTAYSVINVVL